MAIRELLVELGIRVNDEEFDNFTRKLETGIKTLRRFAGPAGLIFAGNVLRNWTGEILDSADAIGKEADQIGVAVERMQLWQEAAKRGGATTEELRIAFKAVTKNAKTAAAGFENLRKKQAGVAQNQTLTEAMEQAALGSNNMAKSFNKLGVNVLNADGVLKDTETLMLELAGAVAEIENPAERAAVAQSVLGEASLKLLPLFKNGRQGVEELLQSLEDLGGGFSGDFIRQSEEANDRLADFDFVMTRVKSTLIGLFLPAIKAGTVVLTRIGSVFAKLEENTNLLSSAFSFLGVRFLIVLFKSLAGPLGKLLRPFSRLWRLARLSGGRLRAFGTVLRALLKPILRFAARILLPIVALDELITFFQGGETLIGKALDAMFGQGFGKRVQEGFSAIFGIVGSIFDILFADTPEEKAKAQQALLAFAEQAKQIFGELAPVVVNVFENAASAIGDFLVMAFNDGSAALGEFLVNGWNQFTAWLGGLATEFLVWAFGLWDQLGTSFDDALVSLSESWNSMWEGMINWVLGKIQGVVNAVGGIGSALQGAASFLGFGGSEGASSGATVPSGGANNVSQENRVQMNITAAPGESAQATGRAAAAALQQQSGLNLQTAISALSQGF